MDEVAAGRDPVEHEGLHARCGTAGDAELEGLGEVRRRRLAAEVAGVACGRCGRDGQALGLLVDHLGGDLLDLALGQRGAGDSGADRSDEQRDHGDEDQQRKR
jgi:hypothetical protein